MTQNLPADSGFDPMNMIHNDAFNSPIYVRPSTSEGRWGAQPFSAQDEYPFPITNHHTAYSYSQLRNIMQLNIELISDLEVLDATSSLLSSSLSPSENADQSTVKIHLPIFRILSHSSQFLDIIQPEVMFPSNDVRNLNLSPITPTEHDSSPREGFSSMSKERIKDCFDDMPNLMSSHDFGRGYEEIRPRLSTAGVFGDASFLGHKLSLSGSLNILSTYCQIIHIYHALFTQIYQAFLMVPPDDAAELLALPTLQFGEFNMEGPFKAKMQVLLELSFSILRKIDHSFGIAENLPGEFNGEGSPASYVPYYNPLESLRDHVVAREYMEAGRNLRKMMHFLQAFFDIADVAI
jgi:hypothetical protein